MRVPQKHGQKLLFGNDVRYLIRRKCKADKQRVMYLELYDEGETNRGTIVVRGVEGF